MVSSCSVATMASSVRACIAPLPSSRHPPARPGASQQISCRWFVDRIGIFFLKQNFLSEVSASRSRPWCSQARDYDIISLTSSATCHEPPHPGTKSGMASYATNCHTLNRRRAPSAHASPRNERQTLGLPLCAADTFWILEKIIH